MKTIGIVGIVFAVMLMLSGIASAVNTSTGVSLEGTTETDITPPAEVTSLAAGTVTTNSIQWTWINPSDSDFVNTLVKVVKTTDGSIIVENVVIPGEPSAAGEYTATELLSGTSYTITVQTQDNAP